MANNTVAPIIIRKKVVAHGGHHGGAWKVAYADFVTAMMALFIVLWLLNCTPKVKESVAGYFKDPTGPSKQSGSAVGGRGESIELEQKDFSKLKEKIEQAMAKAPDFQKLKSHVEMTVTGEGLRIELIEGDHAVFFESGSAKPTVFLRETMSILTGELTRLPNRLLLEGHTDAKPFSDDTNYTNWELSADRANAARRLMQEYKMKPGQVGQVRGFADQFLRDKAHPFSSSNRRISIIVKYDQPEPPMEVAKAGATTHGEPKHGEAAKPSEAGHTAQPKAHSEKSGTAEKDQTAAPQKEKLAEAKKPSGEHH